MRETTRKARKLVKLARTPAAYLPPLRHGVAAAVEHEDVAFEHDFATVVDAGAGRGQFALFARRRFPAATLHCFEPLPESRRKLELVVGGNSSSRATIRPVALGAAPGRAEFHVAATPDSSSLLQATPDYSTGTPGTEQREIIEVEVARLDGALEPADVRDPALLKIDVQGAELDVLRGAGDLLPRFAELLVECSFTELYEGQPLAADVIAWLRDRGFRLAGTFGTSTDESGRCLQADLLFLRS
jgi:FkbM family methyltransferase